MSPTRCGTDISHKLDVTVSVSTRTHRLFPAGSGDDKSALGVEHEDAEVCSDFSWTDIEDDMTTKSNKEETEQ